MLRAVFEPTNCRRIGFHLCRMLWRFEKCRNPPDALSSKVFGGFFVDEVSKIDADRQAAVFLKTLRTFGEVRDR